MGYFLLGDSICMCLLQLGDIVVPGSVDGWSGQCDGVVKALW